MKPGRIVAVTSFCFPDPRPRRAGTKRHPWIVDTMTDERGDVWRLWPDQDEPDLVFSSRSIGARRGKPKPP